MLESANFKNCRHDLRREVDIWRDLWRCLYSWTPSSNRIFTFLIKKFISNSFRALKTKIYFSNFFHFFLLMCIICENIEIVRFVFSLSTWTFWKYFEHSELSENIIISVILYIFITCIHDTHIYRPSVAG